MDNTFDKALEANADRPLSGLHRMRLAQRMRAAGHPNNGIVAMNAAHMTMKRAFVHPMEHGHQAYHEQYHMTTHPGGVLLFRKRNKYDAPSPETSRRLDLPRVLVGTILHHSKDYKLDHPFLAEAHADNEHIVTRDMHPAAAAAVHEAIHEG